MKGSGLGKVLTLVHGSGGAGLQSSRRSYMHVGGERKISEPKSTNQDGDSDLDTCEADQLRIHLDDKPMDVEQESENASNKQCEPTEADTPNMDAEQLH
ncbi:hypothetical protein DY000_02043612 [Brassica cretica]|uniref:Uncharacterized protein n=1 Tax=Brassica cretica TaxID=69181 RepID=A0ABQ7BIU8_BRACR|nr:hypothetical protein DY000_02043612 [Brassica cretica]